MLCVCCPRPRNFIYLTPFVMNSHSNEQWINPPSSLFLCTSVDEKYLKWIILPLLLGCVINTCSQLSQAFGCSAKSSEWNSLASVHSLFFVLHPSNWTPGLELCGNKVKRFYHLCLLSFYKLKKVSVVVLYWTHLVKKMYVLSTHNSRLLTCKNDFFLCLYSGFRLMCYST